MSSCSEPSLHLIVDWVGNAKSGPLGSPLNILLIDREYLILRYPSNGLIDNIGDQLSLYLPLLHPDLFLECLVSVQGGCLVIYELL